MTDERFKNLPEVFREIIEVDREIIEADRATKALNPKVVPIKPPPYLVHLRHRREALRIGASGWGKN